MRRDLDVRLARQGLLARFGGEEKMKNDCAFVVCVASLFFIARLVRSFFRSSDLRSNYKYLKNSSDIIIISELAYCITVRQ